MNKRLMTLILIGLIFVFLGAFLRTATYDDGFYANTVQNTIGLKNPFYSNYDQVKHPFQRIQFGIFALGYNYLFPFNFKWPSFIHAFLLCTSIFFVYVISRRYQDQSKSMLTASLYFYFVYTMYWISPIRPEIWLTTIFLLIVILTERYILFHKIRYIIIASIIIGTFGLTFHTNSWILYIYLLLFLFFHRGEFSSRDVKYILLSLTLSTLVGISIVFMPKPFDTLDYLIRMSHEGGSRITFLWNEIMRFRGFIRNPFHRYISFIITLLVMFWIYGNRKNIIYLNKDAFGQYNNIYLCFGAAFIGLGLLPSARWTVYLAYYYFPISFMFANIYNNSKLSKIQTILFKTCICILFVRFLVIKIIMGQLFETHELIKLLINYIPLFILGISWPHYKVKILYLILIFGMAHQTFIMYQNNIVVQEVSRYFIHHPNLRILTNPQFDWLIVNNDDLWNLMRNKSPELNTGYALIGDQTPWVRKFLQNKSCEFVSLDSINSSFDKNYVNKSFKNLEVYKYECTDSKYNRITNDYSLKEYIKR